MTSYRRWAAQVLARAALADLDDGGGADARAVMHRLEATLGLRPPWLAALAAALVRTGGWQRRDADALAAHIEAAAPDRIPPVRRLILRPPRMRAPPFALEHLALPALPTTGDLAAWLGVETTRLQWLANPALQWREAGPVSHRPASHYRVRHHPKGDGSVRLIEAPLPDLQQAQRRLLTGLLAQVPVHEACHGFVAGRSALTHAAAHVGQHVVVRFDLRDFFPSVRAARVQALWRTLGFPAETARVLTALTTTRTPRPVLAPMRDSGRLSWAAAQRFAAAHLPQGAPTSPALANLCAFRLDLRLGGLAYTFGAQYTRYADDLVFSGPAAMRARLPALCAWVREIAAAEGFTLHRGKTRVMTQHQAQCVGGIMVNRHLNLPRAEFDNLRALLHRCVHDGPEAHNRAGHADFRAHLLGRIGWARQLHPERARKLQALFERIRWSPTPAA